MNDTLHVVESLLRLFIYLFFKRVFTRETI